MSLSATYHYMKELYADIIIDISTDRLDKCFQYRIPYHLHDKIREGMRVNIPFGSSGRIIQGYIISLGDKPKFDPEKTKDIDSCAKDSVSVEGNLIRLAVWMKNTYGSTLIQALKTVLPVKDQIKVKKNRVLVPCKSVDELILLHDDFLKKNNAARARLTQGLIEKGRLTWDEAVKELKIQRELIRQFQEKGILKTESTDVYRNSFSDIYDQNADDEPELVLNDEQAEVYESISKEFSYEDARPVLLHGITGSGKTHLYIRLIKDVVDAGKQVIFLIPEISLTWQTVSRFTGYFKDRVAVINSRLSAGERSDMIRRVTEHEVDLVIGPRSALFTPFDNLGLIIMDEEHDSSYQSEIMPRYHARETAEQRCSLEGANLLLGSATPSLESRYRCDLGRYVLFKLTKRYSDSGLPKIVSVDMRKELKRGNKTLISYLLREAIEQRLEMGEQSILFLNRRGHTGLFTCRNCGFVLKCPHCDIGLTLHNDGSMKCHYCGFIHPVIKNCPDCGSEYIGGLKVGTQQVEELLSEMYPEAKIIRMDRDTTAGKDGYEKILKSFSDGKADILIGTQMIVKGHDFPKVTLMGILAADSSMYASDYKAAELTFQLIVQAAGRSGRGALPGLAVIQTYNPEHYVIEAACVQDYEAFYKDEISVRQLMNYPPVGSMMVIHGSGPEGRKLMNAMLHIKKFIETLRKDNLPVIMGPVSDVISRVQDTYRIVIHIKDHDEIALIRLRMMIEKYININSGFKDIQIQFSLNE